MHDARGVAVKSKIIFILALLSSTASAQKISACFVPSATSCTDIVVQQINAAKTSVYVQAYSFTSKPIENALVAAFKRNVHVEVILDRSNVGSKYSGLLLLQPAGVPTFIDTMHAIAHNKVMIIDESTVLTGSFNFTVSAQKHNAENLIVIDDPTVAASYLANWKIHRAHSGLAATVEK